MVFDLGKRATWHSLPEAEAYVWLFPPAPPGMVEEFLPLLQARAPKLVVVGTTSSYLAPAGEEIVDEETPIDHASPRVQGEELLRARGAVVLRSAGIYGPERNPLDWLRAGRIARADHWVNLIHVEDLALAIGAALRVECSGEQFVVSDGTPRRWRDIALWGQQRGLLGNITFRGDERGSSRQLANAKLVRVLRPPLAHTDLYRELEALEGR
jgi:nucleoside-diphosphate-sugar epimerase